jgi:hypothetical protein
VQVRINSCIHLTYKSWSRTHYMKQLFIFDLDGTLALIEHRRHFIAPTNKKLDWTRFYAACDQDLPNVPVINVLSALLANGADVYVWSGRSDEVLEKTIAWLIQHTPLNIEQLRVPQFRMRPAKNSQPDNDLKRQWLQELNPADRQRLQGVFDDRDKVVRMWREQGVSCFQVAQGDF